MTANIRPRSVLVSLMGACMLLAPAARPEASQKAVPPPVRGGPLQDFTRDVQELVQRVMPSVVQVVATGFAPADPDSGDGVVARQQSVGSGVVIDRDGYIMTNEHVVEGAVRVEVVVGSGGGDSTNGPREGVHAAKARVVGTSHDMDLALLKVDEALTPLPIADYSSIRQGEIVFAFGSPAGLTNSVTMGVVSAVARQADPDDPRVYIQTDAPINRGNSGGPLVNARGELVGINTFIVSNSGGNEGLGFAIPSAMVSLAYPALRQYGHLHRGTLGLDFQTITSDLATGLGLSRRNGVIVSDVRPGGPADAAGVKVGDIIVGAGGTQSESVSSLLFQLYTRNPGEVVSLDVVRGSEAHAFRIVVAERPRADRLTDLIDPTSSLVAPLGILGIAIDKRVATDLPDLRIASGVLVAARVRDWRAVPVGLATGDVIHSVNDVPVTTLEGLRTALDAVPHAGAVVLQVEHDGRLRFVTFAAP